MKIAVCGPDRRLAVVHSDRVLDLQQAAAAAVVPVPNGLLTSLPGLIEAGDRGLDLVRCLSERFDGSDEPGLHLDLHAANLQAPFPGRRFALAGSNNPSHVADAYTNRGQPKTADAVREDARRSPPGGFWVVNPPSATGAEVRIPSNAEGLFDFEGEVAIILKRGGKRIDPDRWKEQVWGATLVIDWSLRSHATLANRLPFYQHKIFDGSKSLGPWICVDEVDPSRCEVVTRVNGEVRQSFNTRDMIHGYGELLAHISQDFTLEPGDLLSGGTGPGTAVDTVVPTPDGRLPLDLFLKPGDRVEVSSPGMGTLSATVGAPDRQV